MKTIKNFLVLPIATAVFLGVSGSALAVDSNNAPIRMTEQQMDQIVAGSPFPHTIVEIDESTSTEYYRGYSNTPAPGEGPGTSSAEVTTTTTTTTNLLCPGASVNSCGAQPTEVVSVTTVTDIVKGPLLSGPGQSFGHRF
jgi:hypothetical protein